MIVFLKNHPHLEYSKSWIYFLAPFFSVLKEPVEIYHCFAKFVNLFAHHISTSSIGPVLANFIMLVRLFHPDLLSYVEEEELSPNDWAVPWLRHLLCRELPLPDLLRLWDTYLAVPDAFELHMFTCLGMFSVGRFRNIDFE